MHTLLSKGEAIAKVAARSGDQAQGGRGGKKKIAGTSVTKSVTPGAHTLNENFYIIERADCGESLQPSREERGGWKR